MTAPLALVVPHHLVLAEIVGSVASEEGLHATVRDVQRRHAKRPFDARSYIPTRCQTLAAPRSIATCGCSHMASPVAVLKK